MENDDIFADLSEIQKELMGKLKYPPALAKACVDPYMYEIQLAG